MKRMLLILICCTLALPILGETTRKPLDKIMKPQFVDVNGDRLYVTENANVFVYSLKDYKLLHSFGKAGEGPQEFKIFPGTSLHIDFKDGAPVVFSIGKISFFSKDGAFVSEKKTTRMLSQVYFLGDSFAAVGFKQQKQETLLTVDICDQNLVKKKEIYSYEVVKGTKIKLLEKSFSFKTESNRIYIAGGNKFLVKIMDAKGNEISRVEQDYERVKITRAHKDEIFRWYKTNPLTRPTAEEIIKAIQLPSHLPAIKDFRVSKGILYIQTYKRKNNKIEFYVFNVKGKKPAFIKKILLPVDRKNPIEEMQYFTIRDGKFCQLLETDEGWEVEVIGL